MGMERKKWLLLAFFCFIFSLYLFISGGTYYWNGYSSRVLPIQCEAHAHLVVYLMSHHSLCPYFSPLTLLTWSVCLVSWCYSNFGRKSNESHKKSFKLKCLIALLLLMSRNVQPNPGPDTPIGFNTPADFKERSGLGFFHLNVCSLFPKMDMLRIWAHTTDTDVIILSETW